MKPTEYPTHPSHIWEHFYQITQIPRPSGQEQEMRAYIIGLAEQLGHRYVIDNVGNLVVYVPASAGFEGAPAVAIQNHLDMVTVKTGDKEHDFSRDALQLMIEDGWLKADRTTLGADNGIGVAAALALMTDDSVVHPALELVFTTEEETGLHGAQGFDASLLSAHRMLNLDTEDWGEIYIGCAGGYGYEAQRQVTEKLPKPGLVSYIVHLKGLAGGHSGVQIHEQLGNANKLLVEFLRDARQLEYQLVSFRGGIAHNVIAREASAVLMLNPSQVEHWQRLLDSTLNRWKGFLPEADQSLQWRFEPVDVEQPLVVANADTESFLNLISVLPHGAQSYNLKQPADLVDLSCNLAVIYLQKGVLQLQTSLRFFNEQQAVGLKQQIEAVFRTFMLSHKVILDYPGWNPNFDSPLVALSQRLAYDITGQPVALKAIHAGLECGILLSKKPDMDVVSMGPTIRGAHSPSERLKMDTVEPFWLLLSRLLAELAEI